MGTNELLVEAGVAGGARAAAAGAALVRALRTAAETLPDRAATSRLAAAFASLARRGAAERRLALAMLTDIGEYAGRRPGRLELFHEIADEAAYAGVVLVCPANNVPAPTYPAQFSSVISVAPHESTNPFCIDANVSRPVDFGAPGIDPGMPWVDGGTIVSTGNSLAAPHVTGLVARMLSEHPHLTPYEVKTVLRAVASNAERKDGGCNGG